MITTFLDRNSVVMIAFSCIHEIRLIVTTHSAAFDRSTKAVFEGSGQAFPFYSCVDSDDEDCLEQFSGSLVDAALDVRRNSSNQRVTKYADKASPVDSARGKGRFRQREKPGPSVATPSAATAKSRTTSSGPPNRTPVSVGSASTNIANLRIHTTPSSNSRVGTPVGGRRRGGSSSSSSSLGLNGSDPSSGGDSSTRNEEEEQDKGRRTPQGQATGSSSVGRSVGLVAGASVGAALLLLVICFAVFKYRSRDEGTYKIDNRNYTYEVCGGGGGGGRTEENGGSSCGGVYKLRSLRSKQKRKDVKEWYV